MGRSGSGKSLLSRLVLGFVPPAPAQVTGTVQLTDGEGRCIDANLSSCAPGQSIASLATLRGSFLGYLPQGGRENLVPGWSLERHIDVLTGGCSERSEASYAGMARLGLDPSRSVRSAVATQLSEGMIRRALLALFVALPTEVLIADEPTTGLDPESREAVVTFLAETIGDGQRGLLLTTHDLSVARSLGNSFIHVVDGRLDAVTDGIDTADSPFASFVEAETLLGAGVR